MGKWILSFYFILSANYVLSKDLNDYLHEIKQGPNLSNLDCIEDSSKNVCESLIEKYRAKKQEFWKLFREPISFGFQYPIGSGFDEKASELEGELINIGSECLEAQYKSCYPNLRNQIEMSKLSTMFEGLKSDARFRMNQPAVFCYQRAKLLAKTLADSGYESEQLMIQKAPVLIAPLLDPKDNYRNRYIDYHGTHHVISVKVAPDGREYILDPQFAEAPLPKEEYFRLTIGENCEDAPNPSKPWGCNFQKYHPTWERPFLETFRPVKSEKSKAKDYIEAVIEGDENKAKCGFLPQIDSNVSINNKQEIMTNKNKISEKMRASFIIAGLENRYKQEQAMLKYYEESLIQLQSDPSTQDLIPSTKDQLVKAKAKIIDYEEHIKSVCQNLRIKRKNCFRIRADYKKYLPQETP